MLLVDREGTRGEGVVVEELTGEGRELEPKGFQILACRLRLGEGSLAPEPPLAGEGEALAQVDAGCAVDPIRAEREGRQADAQQRVLEAGRLRKASDRSAPGLTRGREVGIAFENGLDQCTPIEALAAGEEGIARVERALGVRVRAPEFVGESPVSKRSRGLTR